MADASISSIPIKSVIEGASLVSHHEPTSNGESPGFVEQPPDGTEGCGAVLSWRRRKEMHRLNGDAGIRKRSPYNADASITLGAYYTGS